MSKHVDNLYCIHISCDSHFYCFFLQLDYVVYRRVLRYYSGEEDGLGELQCMTLRKLFVFGPSVLLLLISVSDFLFFLSRYEEGFIKRRGKEVYYPSQTTDHSR